MTSEPTNLSKAFVWVAIGTGLLLLAGAPFLVAQARTISPGTLALCAALVSYICFIEYMRAGERSVGQNV